MSTVKTLRLAASAHGNCATGDLLTECADSMEHLLGVIEEWAKLALDLNTFAQHDDTCSANKMAVEARGCDCGLSKLSKITTHRAERLVTYLKEASS